MLGSKIIGVMESLKYDENHVLYQRDYEVVVEINRKVSEQYKSFIEIRETFLENKNRLDQIRALQEQETVSALDEILAKIDDLDESYLKQNQEMLPLNQGSIILFQQMATICHTEILEELGEYYTLDALLEQAKVGVRYLGREEEIFKGLDVYYMLREITHVLEGMNSQVEGYIDQYTKLKEQFDEGVKMLEVGYQSAKSRWRKKVNFYRMGYEQRKLVQRLYGEQTVIRKINKLPLYQGSLEKSHIFLEQLIQHLEQGE